MSEQVYKDMVEVMRKRGVVFGGMDIPEFYPVAKALFTPEEAAINNAMPQKTFTAAELAEIMGRDEAELAVTLKQMADKGLCNTHMKENLRLFRPAPFVPVPDVNYFSPSHCLIDRCYQRLIVVGQPSDGWRAFAPQAATRS
jgi:hypothetical protein